MSGGLISYDTVQYAVGYLAGTLNALGANVEAKQQLDILKGQFVEAEEEASASSRLDTAIARAEGDDAAPSKPRQPWSEEDVNTIKSSLAQGMSAKEIGALFPERSYSTVYTKVNTIKTSGGDHAQ